MSTPWHDEATRRLRQKEKLEGFLAILRGAVFRICLVVLLTNCANNPAPKTKIPDPTVDFDSGWVHTDTCRPTTTVYVNKADGPEIAKHTRNAVFYWNQVLGLKRLEYGGRRDLDFTDYLTDYFMVFKAPPHVEKVWDDMYKNIVLGTAYRHRVERLSSIHEGRTEVVLPPVAKKGPTLLCVIGGRIWWRDSTQYKFLLETVIIHEMGHLLGFDDTYDEGIMNRTISHKINFFQNIGPQTAAEIEFLYGDPIETRASHDFRVTLK